MQNLIKLKSAYLHDLAVVTRKRRACAWIGSGLIIAGALALMLMFSGCSTTQPGPGIGPAALQAAVTLGTEFGLERYPQATPAVRIAATTVCAAANGTNIAPSDIVASLGKLGITNNESKIILNGSLALYQVAYAAYGSNLVQFQDYAKALCNGLTEALPPEGPPAPMAAKKSLPPHL